jgi:hypothetical protein
LFLDLGASRRLREIFIGTCFPYRVICKLGFALPPPLTYAAGVTATIRISNTFIGNFQNGAKVSGCGHITFAWFNRIWVDWHRIGSLEGARVNQVVETPSFGENTVLLFHRTRDCLRLW